MTILLYLGLGAVAGTIAGLFGLGGGIIIVPVLVFTFSWQGFSPEHLTHLAIATSMATIIITATSSTLTHHKLGAIHWPVVARMSIGIVGGTFIGAMLADSISGENLKRLFALFAYLVALQMFFSLKPKATNPLPKGFALSGIGAVIGAISAIFGIGGGSLSVPYLTSRSVPMRNAVALSAALGLPLAISGTFGYIVSGFHENELPPYSLGYVYLPAWLGIVLTSAVFAKIGARLAHRLPPVLMKRLFSVFLFIVGSKFLFG
ncbi:sulfite exporter TauE/SafE family protein [Motilimonas pumila]|uniref:Probable membrane transporter protein n=1 Tax=Motilimonas pumila TaxID=2303987 RepID=A0A418YBN0_9GAMM|nr:sulfite exporter TauE/SafE family protein [Motilimonas pumila]RJG41888.1 sulfite exporter TauE/SafE family protein [Motilimonas pumila]